GLPCSRRDGLGRLSPRLNTPLFSALQEAAGQAAASSGECPFHPAPTAGLPLGHSLPSPVIQRPHSGLAEAGRLARPQGVPLKTFVEKAHYIRGMVALRENPGGGGWSRAVACGRDAAGVF